MCLLVHLWSLLYIFCQLVLRMTLTESASFFSNLELTLWYLHGSPLFFYCNIVLLPYCSRECQIEVDYSFCCRTSSNKLMELVNCQHLFRLKLESMFNFLILLDKQQKLSLMFHILLFSGMDVITNIATIPTYKPAERIRQFNDFAQFIGDERAQIARTMWNRPLKTVYISDCGELKVATPSLSPSLP